MLNKLFVRPINQSSHYQELVLQWSKWLNTKTINHWSLKKTMEMFDPKTENEFLTFRFQVLQKWFLLNKENGYFLSDQLIRQINALNLQNYLNAYEINFLMDTNSKQFTLKRNLKSLIVDFELAKNEYAYFHYRKLDVKLPFIDYLIKDVDFYLTTKRIVFTYSNNIISFNLNAIERLTFKDGYFTFVYFSKEYKFITTKSSLILVSFQRLYRELKQDFRYGA